MNDLAERTFTHQSTVSAVVTRLARRGLVVRGRSASDARRTEIVLTSAGRAVLRRAMSVAQTRLIEALERMPTARLRLISACLDDVVQAVGAGGAQPGMFFEDLPAELLAPRARTRTAGTRSAAKAGG